MIVRMGKSPDDQIKEAIAFFHSRHLDVHINNKNGEIVLAVFGQDVSKITEFEIKWLRGAIEIEQSNDLFFAHISDFCEAWEYK